ncbi:hypothetical protein [Thermaurantiacus sp.]
MTAHAQFPVPRPAGGTFLGFATDADSRRAIAMAAAARGWASPEVLDGGLEAAHARLADGSAPGVLVVDLSSAKAPLPEIDALADLCDPDTKVIAIGTRNDVGLYRGLRSLGVADYLLKPVEYRELAAAIDFALETSAAAPVTEVVPKRQAFVVALVGSRGGAGTSVLAAALAARMAAEGLSTVLVDLDFQGGSLALDLDLEPSPAILGLLESPDRLDPLVVTQAMRPHRAGFRLIAADAPIEAGLAIEPDAVLALLAAAGADADIVIADLPRWLDRSRRAVLRTADRLAIITPPTLAGLRDTRRLVQLATGLRAGQRPLLVGNRAGAQGAELDWPDFGSALGMPIDVLLPEDPAAARAAAEGATTLAATASPALARALAKLASALQPESALPTSPGLGRWQRRLARLLGRVPA